MIQIVRATIKDLNGLKELFEAYRRFYNKSSDFNAAMDFLRLRIENEESVIFLAVEENGKYCGFTQLYPLFSSTRMKRLWLLNDLYVLEPFRGKGISRKLIEAAKKLCVDTNACSLILETAKTNEIGNNLYPGAGFVLDEEHNFYSWDTPQ